MIQIIPRMKLRIPAWAGVDHPIFRLEIQRLTRNRSLNFLQYSFNPLIFAGIGLTILFVAVALSSTLAFSGADNFLQGVLGWTIGILASVQVVAGAFANVLVIAQISASISGEIELQSWRLLRTTTLNLKEIVFAKLAAALLNLRLLLVGLLVLRIVTTVSAMLMVAYVLLRQILYSMSTTSLQSFFSEYQWGPILVPVAVCAFAFMTQPPIQFALNGVIGMLASAYSRTRAQAVAMGLIGRLALWVLSALFNIAASYGLGFLILGNWMQPESATIEAFRNLPRPSEMQIAWAIGLTISLYVLAILAAQLGMILLGAGMILRRARQLGV